MQLLIGNRWNLKVGEEAIYILRIVEKGLKLGGVVMNKIEFLDRVKQTEYKIEVDTLETMLFGEDELSVDHNGISNRKIEIFYILRKSIIDNAPYMFFFNGGPGIGFTDHYFEHDGYSSFMPDYNVVLMDQRGSGFSSEPIDNILEYKYFASKYICYDAELLKKKLIGDESKIIVFGQSFGGYLVRKYLELYCNSASVGISHGYGVCSCISMKVNIEKSLLEQVDSYFFEYPEDKDVFLKLRAMLDDRDTIGTTSRSLIGGGIIDIFAFYFGIYSYEKIHNIIAGLDKENLKVAFMEEIKHLGNIILDSGVLNSIVAYIDLVEGMSDHFIYTETEKQLKEEGIEIEKELFSTVRLSKNIINISDMVIEMEKCFKNNVFHADPLDMEKLCNNLRTYNVVMNVIGSTNDSITPLSAIEEERERVSALNMQNNYKFIISNGNHREWKYNSELISHLIAQNV